MAPPLAFCGQLFGSKLRVVDKNIRSLGELQQTFVQFRIARLVIGGVHDGSRRSFKTEAEAALRMMEPPGDHLRARNTDLVSAAYFCKFTLRAHGVEIHREVRIRHLRFKHALQAARS